MRRWRTVMARCARVSRLGTVGLTYPQVFLLVIGFGLASAIIFLFGMWVGRDIAERKLAQEERLVRAPVPVQATQAPEEPKVQEVDRAFYERLKEKAAQRLQDTPLALPSIATPTSARGVQFALPTRTALRFEMPTQRPTARPTSTPRPRPTVALPPATKEENDWADAGWTVQVGATTDSEEAHETTQTLRAHGFDAYTVQAPTRGGQTWYRVRVGRFNNHEKAKARELESRLRSEENLPNAYVTPQ